MKKEGKKCNGFLPNVSRDPHLTCTICCKNECFRTILVCLLWDEEQWTKFDVWDHDIAVKKENKEAQLKSSAFSFSGFEHILWPLHHYVMHIVFQIILPI